MGSVDVLHCKKFVEKFEKGKSLIVAPCDPA